MTRDRFPDTPTLVHDRANTTPFRPCSLAFETGYLAGIEANIGYGSAWPEDGASADFGAGYRCGWHSAHNLHLAIRPERMKRTVA